MSFKHSAIDELKTRAQILKRQHRNADQLAIARVSARLKKAAPGANEDLSHKQALLTIARESGFMSWQQALQVLSGDVQPGDNFGEFWYSPLTMSTLNHWCTSYTEAKAIQQQKGGYLIPYKTQFAVVAVAYVESIGLAHQGKYWQQLNHDLSHGPLGEQQTEAYQQLVKQRVQHIGAVH